MGLDKIKAELLRDARKQADVLVSEAEAEVKAIVDKKKEEIKEQQKNAQAQVKEECKRLQTKQEFATKFEVKKQVLEAKESVVDEVFELAKAKLTKMAKAQKTKMYANLVSEAKKQIKVAKILTNKKDKALVKGASWEEADIFGGVIAQNKDGSIIIDLSFDTLLAALRKDLIKDLHNELF